MSTRAFASKVLPSADARWRSSDQKFTSRPSASKARNARIVWPALVNVASTVALSSWLPPPSNILASGGTYSFSAVSGATLHGGEIQDMTGKRVWSITVFDGSTSFTLPGLSPDPLPQGMLTFGASALQIPGISLGNVALDDARDKITGMSNDFVTFTH